MFVFGWKCSYLDGNESSFIDCQHNKRGVNDCTQLEVVGVSCETNRSVQKILLIIQIRTIKRIS